MDTEGSYIFKEKITNQKWQRSNSIVKLIHPIQFKSIFVYQITGGKILEPKLQISMYKEMRNFVI